MQKLWERERIEREELELQSDTVRELRDMLRPSIESLVRKRKIRFLKEGATFGKIVLGKTQTVAKGEQFWRWQLDESERQLSYVDTTDAQSVEANTKKTVSIMNIRRLVHGAEYSDRIFQQVGVKAKKNNASSLLRCGFCIELADESLNLCADDEAKLQAWVDGLNCLINPDRALNTPLLKAEVERLLNLEVRVRLLDVDNPPSTNLPFPEPPKDFSWIPQNFPGSPVVS
jgi:hypothetical protein